MCHSVIPSPPTSRTQWEPVASGAWLSRAETCSVVVGLADASGKSARWATPCPQDEFTGQESYVWDKMNRKDITFFPLNKSMDLNLKSGFNQTNQSSTQVLPGLLHPPFSPRHVGFSLPGGGGVNRDPQNWGGGEFGERAQMTGTINQSL